MTKQPQSSRIPRFYNNSLDERRSELASRGRLTSDKLAALYDRIRLFQQRLNIFWFHDYQKILMKIGKP